MAIRARLANDQRERNAKSLSLIVLVALFFSILFLRLFHLQVIQGQTNIRLSKENQMRLVTLDPPRGRIFDRNGEVLARNRPSYSLSVLPYQLKDNRLVIERLLQIRNREGIPLFDDSTALAERIHKARFRRFDVTRLAEDISIDAVSVVEEHSMELPGIMIVTEPRREYPLGEETYHVLGYMTEIPENLFDSLKNAGYHYGDLIGKDGLEKQYETILRGQSGSQYIEVNAYGRSLGPIENMPHTAPIPGHDLYTTIDLRLQRAAAKAFPDSLKGAVVALDPRTGSVLVMVSSPSLDPNIFSQATSLRSRNWAAVAADPDRPLNNRATMGTYTPGSTFKLVTSVAGLASGQIGSHEFMPSTCHGAYRIGNRVAHCWNLSGHGSMDVIDALKQSCNVFFYQVGLRIGDESINRYARLFGLGAITGIDLPQEKSGWLSGEKAYNLRFSKRGWKWTRGLVLDLAIGQTQVLTPLQLAFMVGGMGNGKVLHRPHLMHNIRDVDGVLKQHSRPVVFRELGLDETTVSVLREAMQKVIEPGGTGGSSRVESIPVGGKTGSAQNPQGDKTHSLFVACAPVDNPVIAIAVVAENAGHGGSVAAPIAGKVLRAFFDQTEEGQQLVQLYRQRARGKAK